MQLFVTDATAPYVQLPKGFEPLGDDGGFEWVDGTGPDGTPGAIGKLVRSRIRTNIQRPRLVERMPTITWHRLANGFYCGWYGDTKPTPAILERDDALPGERLRLGDGNEWLIPVARQLPAVVGMSGTPKVAPEVGAFYSRFVELAFRILDAKANNFEDGHKVTDAEAAELAVLALSTNYRLTRELINAFGLLESDHIRAIAETVIEYQAAADVLTRKPTLRYAVHRQWRDGLLPGYAPSVLDLYALSREGSDA